MKVGAHRKVIKENNEETTFCRLWKITEPIRKKKYLFNQPKQQNKKHNKIYKTHNESSLNKKYPIKWTRIFKRNKWIKNKRSKKMFFCSKKQFYRVSGSNLLFILSFLWFIYFCLDSFIDFILYRYVSLRISFIFKILYSAYVFTLFLRFSRAAVEPRKSWHNKKVLCGDIGYKFVPIEANLSDYEYWWIRILFEILAFVLI